MPIYEYKCPPCQSEFEELLTLSDDVKKYADWHPCPSCGGRAERLRMSVTNFQFAGGVRGETGVHGQSGSHDLDYPTLDKAVGRSSDKKWTRINQEKETRSKIRKEAGTNALSKIDGKIVPTSPDVLKLRTAAAVDARKIREAATGRLKKPSS
ncbi:MAG: Zinc ribbon domain protein [Synergistetes bacterium ADurb.BinA166]|nr:MAG: Zinc ribbon domain protein [Synergistetes bacterium ADurb.BinA166]